MEYWRVGLREVNGRHFCAKLDNLGRPVLETRVSYRAPADALNALLRELQDWQEYERVRLR